jgi:hypothetical protein
MSRAPVGSRASTRPDAGDVLVRCLREPHPRSPSSELLQLLDDADLPALTQLASAHGVLPLLGVLLRDADLPDDLQTTLKIGRHGQLIRHQVVMEELGIVAGALDAVSVPWITMKGPVLSERCYPRPDLRGYGDLDVLVPPADFPAAVAALVAGGATLVDRNWPLAHRQMRGELMLTLPRGTVLDLHWHVLNEPEARSWFRLDPSAMVARRRPVQLGPTAAWTFDPQDTLVHLAVHSLLNGMRRLVWLCDLRMAHAAFAPDDQLTTRRAREAGLELALAAVAQRAARLLDAPELTALARPASGVSWLGFLRAVDRVRPPQSHGTGELSLAHVASSTRATPSASVRALTGWGVREGVAVLRDPDHPLRRRSDAASRRAGPPEDNPLHRAEGTPADRAAYLEAVAGFRPT